MGFPDIFPSLLREDELRFHHEVLALTVCTPSGVLLQRLPQVTDHTDEPRIMRVPPTMLFKITELTKTALA